ncbi:LysR substrate-binding domain-containing protein [Accumulibacter sp.]|uniref:LysR substrate-binding domain-containing protein n=1 Tax=Accumulibacter sp. TaxID=2053492 RepID=UPI002637F8A1|nr:LysR substrate-binding domain-containing protein [Accumulibacter sp.]
MQERIRIAMPVDLGVDIVGPIVGRFLAEHPGLHVEFNLWSHVADPFCDPIDLAFRIGKVVDQRVVARRIATITSGLYASPVYLQRHGTIVSTDQLDKRCAEPSHISGRHALDSRQPALGKRSGSVRDFRE